MSNVVRLIACALAVLIGAAAASAQSGDRSTGVVRIGSKNFTEQEVLGELMAQLIEAHTDLRVERRLALGGTDLCHAALIRGELDIYAEYTGTALVNILKQPVIAEPFAAYLAASEAYRELFEVEWLPPIGFNNTYAMSVRPEMAVEQQWENLSAFAADAGEYTAGFPSEFMERPDGLPGLREAYGLRFGRVVELEPGLMYGAVARGEVDLICGFVTDPRIAQYGLAVLEDDRRFFPPYDAAPLVRAETLDRHPELRSALAPLAGTIDDAEMRAINARVDIDGLSPREAAREWLAANDLLATDADVRIGTGADGRGFFGLLIERRVQLLRKTWRHLQLTLAGVGIAIAIGLPVGVWIHHAARARGPVLAGAEMVQTIPSLAMLAFLFALFGVLGAAPAIAALALYALLPIILNTYTGLSEVPPRLREAALGVGMTRGQRLRLVELPSAAPVIIAGVRTSTVLTVGIATLSTYIGAGGLGDFIQRGLARNDPRLTLLGAVPAALLAVVLSLGIRLLEIKLGGGRTKPSAAV